MLANFLLGLGASLGASHARPTPPTRLTQVPAFDIGWELELELWARELNGVDRNPLGIELPRVWAMTDALVHWNDRWFIETSSRRGSRALFEVDTVSDQAREVRFGPRSHLQCVASDGEVLYAVVRGDRGLRLLQRRVNSDVSSALPRSLAYAEAVIAARAGRIVIASNSEVLVIEGDARRTYPLRTPTPPGGHWPPTRIRVRGDDAWLSWNCGEWGGALARLDLRDGSLRVVSEVDGPVTDFDWDPQGRLWVTAGVAHGGTHGAVLQCADGTWSVIAETEDTDSQLVPGRSTGWRHPASVFEALCFDREQLYVLAETTGLVRRDHEEWICVTPWWPTRTYTVDVAVEGTHAWILTLNAGLISANLATGSRRVIGCVRRASD